MSETEIRFSAGEMSRLFRVSERAITQWAAEGMPFARVKGRVNEYPYWDCLMWWIANKYTGATAASDRPPPKAETEARLLQTKARREEIRLHQDLKALAPVAELEAMWVQVATIAKDRVLNIPAAVKLVRSELTGEDVAAIKKACHEALEAIAECPTPQ